VLFVCTRVRLWRAYFLRLHKMFLCGIIYGVYMYCMFVPSVVGMWTSLYAIVSFILVDCICFFFCDDL
jgi:hypothetical protein